MAERRKTKQGAHDKAIRRIAGGLRANGWKVQADVAGAARPKIVNGRRPDIVARKAGERTRIIEVETRPEDDKDQHKALRRHARTYQQSFRGVLVDKAGRIKRRFR